MDEEYKYSETTRKIIGAGMAVHKMLGNGYREVTCQRALAIEFAKRRPDFQREPIRGPDPVHVYPEYVSSSGN